MPRPSQRPREGEEGSELSVVSRHDEDEQHDTATPVTREEFNKSYKDALKEMAIHGFPIAFIRLLAAFGDSWWWTLFTKNQTLFPVASLVTVIQMVILNFSPTTLYSTSNMLSQRLAALKQLANESPADHPEEWVAENRLKTIEDVYKAGLIQALTFGAGSMLFFLYGLEPMLRAAGIDSDSVQLIKEYFEKFAPGLIPLHLITHTQHIALGLDREKIAGIMMLLNAYLTAELGHQLSPIGGYWSTAAGVGTASSIAAAVTYVSSITLLRSRSDEFFPVAWLSGLLKPDWSTFKKLVSNGVFIGSQVALELVGVLGAVFLVKKEGALPSEAIEIAIDLLTPFVLMVFIMSHVMGIRMGEAARAYLFDHMKKLHHAGQLYNFLISSVLMAGLVGMPEKLMLFFTDISGSRSEEFVTMTKLLFIWIALTQLLDAIRTGFGRGALGGVLSDNKTPALAGVVIVAGGGTLLSWLLSYFMRDPTAEADDQHLSALLWIATGRLIAIGSAAAVLFHQWWNKGTPEKIQAFHDKEQAERTAQSPDETPPGLLSRAADHCYKAVGRCSAFVCGFFGRRAESPSNVEETAYLNPSPQTMYI